MKMFSFCCHGLGYLSRLITRSIFRAFNRVLRLDKSEGVYQDCEGNDTTGMPFFVSMRETLSSSASFQYMHLNFVKELKWFLSFFVVPILPSETETVVLKKKNRSLEAENLNTDEKRMARKHNFS